MKIIKTYVAPKNLRENQYNCVFTLLHDFRVNQFDVKGDNDRVFDLNEQTFNDNFEIIGYAATSRFVSNRLTPHKLLYGEKPLDLIKTSGRS